MSQPRLATWDWSVAKQGNAEGENDDACRVERIPGEGGVETLLIAISDGATEAVYSGRWARALVEAAEADWPEIGPGIEVRLLPVRQKFQPFDPQAELPWYVREKFLTQGSQATLLTVTVSPEASGVFGLKAVAMGDSCLLLFHISEEEYAYRAFPLDSAADFGANPMLVRNQPSPVPRKYQKFDAQMRAGDLLLACTDAVAKWAMDCLESGGANQLFDALCRLTSHAPAAAPQPDQPEAEHQSSWREWLVHKLRLDRAAPIAVPEQPLPAEPLDFAEFVARCRQPDTNPRMRNDDATLVVCACGHDVLLAHRDAAGRLPVRCVRG